MVPENQRRGRREEARIGLGAVSATVEEGERLAQTSGRQSVAHEVRKVGNRWFNETFGPAGRGGQDLLHPSPEFGAGPPTLLPFP